MPLTVDELKMEVMRGSAATVQILTTDWIEECAKIVNENKESVELSKENGEEVNWHFEFVKFSCFCSDNFSKSFQPTPDFY